MTGRLVYVYGAVRAAAKPRLGAGWSRLPGGSAPRAVSAGRRLWLAVADVPAADYGAGRIDDRVGDLDWLSQTGAAHHDVLGRLAARYAVAPFRLMTVFASETAAVAGIDRRRATIERALDDIQGCREWVVRAAVDPSARSAARPARGDGSGTAYLLARAAERTRAKAALPRGAAALARRATANLRTLSRRTARRSGAAPQGLLLEIALLVPRARERTLSRALTRWSPEFAALGCRLWQTGPWPAYSFVTPPRRASRRHG